MFMYRAACATVDTGLALQVLDADLAVAIHPLPSVDDAVPGAI
jgi:hypothetical protein